jgi:hypothetical protein
MLKQKEVCHNICFAREQVIHRTVAPGYHDIQCEHNDEDRPVQDKYPAASVDQVIGEMVALEIIQSIRFRIYGRRNQKAREREHRHNAVALYRKRQTRILI